MKELYLEKAHDYLALELTLRKERRPAYSMRAFARDLQMSPSSLTDVLKGRQGLSEERARLTAKILKWSPERYEHFWNLLQAQFAADPAKRNESQKIITHKINQLKSYISLDSFKMISDWHHLAILTLLQMNPEGLSEKGIAESLDFSLRTVKDSAQRLQRLELATLTEGRWSANAQRSHSGDEAPSDAVRSFHAQILRQAQDALEKFEMQDRENFSVVYSIEEKYMPQIHQDIRHSILNILNEYSQKSKDDSVQVLTLQMFPVSKPPKKVQQ